MFEKWLRVGYCTHNLTNIFQLLEISVNQKAKRFISHKFNTWYTDRVFSDRKKKTKKKQLKKRFSSRGCESIKENVRLETSACALDSCYLHPPKATERIDSEWNWQSCHNSGCQVSKWSIREDWKPFRTLEKWANEM